MVLNGIDTYAKKKKRKKDMYTYKISILRGYICKYQFWKDIHINSNILEDIHVKKSFKI